MPQDTDPLQDKTVDKSSPGKPSTPKAPPGPPDIGEIDSSAQSEGSGFRSVPGAGPNPTGGVERR